MRNTVLSVFVCLLTMSGLPAFAQTNNPNSPNVSKPSEQNSGAGVPGFAGNKNGPAAKRARWAPAPQRAKIAAFGSRIPLESRACRETRAVRLRKRLLIEARESRSFPGGMAQQACRQQRRLP